MSTMLRYILVTSEYLEKNVNPCVLERIRLVLSYKFTVLLNWHLHLLDQLHLYIV